MKKLFLLIPAVALMAACQKEVPQGNDREVEIRITAGSTLNGVKTRAPGSEAEDAIKTVAVLVFDNSETPDDHGDAVYKRSTHAWEKSTGLYSALLEVGDNQDIYFAINAKAAVDAAVAAASATSTFNEIRAALKLTAAVNIVGGVPVDGLPMWGYRHNTSVTAEAGNSFGTVKVLRAVAAAEITVAATNFELTQGNIEYASEQGYLAYNVGDNIDFADGEDPEAPQSDYRLLAPEVPTDATTGRSIEASQIEDEVVGSEQQQKIFDQLYFFENDKTETLGGNRKYTKVVIGGVYDPTPEDLTDNVGLVPTFYPLAFRDPDAMAVNNSRVPIIRNSKFVFKITKVNGKGFDDVETARDAEDQNIQYQVIQWDQWDDGDIVTWGNFWLSVGKSRNETALGANGAMKTAALYRNASSNDEISFTSNITDFTNFTIAGMIEGYTDFDYTPTTGDGLRTGETLVKSIANAHYEIFLIKGTAAPDADGTPGRILFVARENFDDRTDLNADDPNETLASLLTIGSGEIEYGIKVLQRNTALEDWIPEDDQEYEAGSTEQ